MNACDINATYRNLIDLRAALIGKDIDEVRSTIRIPTQTILIGGDIRPTLSWEEKIVNPQNKTEPTLLIANFEWNDDSGHWICNGVE